MSLQRYLCLTKHQLLFWCYLELLVISCKWVLEANFTTKTIKNLLCCFQDESVLIWFSGKEEKHLKLSHVSRIISGQRTVSFLLRDNNCL